MAKRVKKANDTENRDTKITPDSEKNEVDNKSESKVKRKPGRPKKSTAKKTTEKPAEVKSEVKETATPTKEVEAKVVKPSADTKSEQPKPARKRPGRPKKATAKKTTAKPAEVKSEVKETATPTKEVEAKAVKPSADTKSEQPKPTRKRPGRTRKSTAKKTTGKPAEVKSEVKETTTPAKEVEAKAVANAKPDTAKTSEEIKTVKPKPARKRPGRPKKATAKKTTEKPAEVKSVAKETTTPAQEVEAKAVKPSADTKSEQPKPARKRPGRPKKATAKKTTAKPAEVKSEVKETTTPTKEVEAKAVKPSADTKSEQPKPARKRPGSPRKTVAKKTTAKKTTAKKTTAKKTTAKKTTAKPAEVKSEVKETTTPTKEVEAKAVKPSADTKSEQPKPTRKRPGRTRKSTAKKTTGKPAEVKSEVKETTTPAQEVEAKAVANAKPDTAKTSEEIKTVKPKPARKRPGRPKRSADRQPISNDNESKETVTGLKTTDTQSVKTETKPGQQKTTRKRPGRSKKTTSMNTATKPDGKKETTKTEIPDAKPEEQKKQQHKRHGGGGQRRSAKKPEEQQRANRRNITQAIEKAKIEDNDNNSQVADSPVSKSNDKKGPGRIAPQKNKNAHPQKDSKSPNQQQKQRRQPDNQQLRQNKGHQDKKISGKYQQKSKFQQEKPNLAMIQERKEKEKTHYQELLKKLGLIEKDNILMDKIPKKSIFSRRRSAPVKKDSILTKEQRSDLFLRMFHSEVEKYLKNKLFVEPGSEIVVAVSGGVDSVVLLDTLVVLAEKNYYRLIVAHYNHNLRAEESDKDEEFVKALAKSYGLTFHCSQGRVKQYAEKKSLSIEESARILRYMFLERVARNVRSTLVATAHSKDDSAETFLINLLRGSGLTGLSGIPSQRALGKNVTLVRPLLAMSKSQFKKYAEKRNLQWREDESNEFTNYTRNKVRLDLIPELVNEYNPKIMDVLNRTAKLINGADEFISEYIRNILDDVIGEKNSDRFAIKTSLLNTFSRFIQGEIIQAAMFKHFQLQSQSLKTIDRILALCNKAVGSICEISRQIIVLRDRENLIFVRKPSEEKVNQEINKTGFYKTPAYTIKLEEVREKDVDFTLAPQVEFFDFDLIPLKMTLRSWQPGDKFQPLGMKGEMKLSDFLTNSKVPLIDKSGILVLTTGKNDIVWVCGMRINDKFKISSTTKKYLKVSYNAT